MRVEISGVVQKNPTTKGSSTSFRMVGGGPFVYAYGSLGEKILQSVSQGDAVIASGNLNYAQDGQGDWQKYINLDGGISIMPNVKQREDEKPKLTFTLFGKINNITPQSTNKGEMAKFKIEETVITWRGEKELTHSMVAFGGVAEKILNEFSDGQNVVLMGDVQRLTNNNDEWYTSFKATALREVEVEEMAQQSSQEQPQESTIDEDDIPF